MKKIGHLLAVFFIVVVQIGSTGFGYFHKTCSVEGTSAITFTYQQCSCKHKKKKPCCHKNKILHQQEIKGGKCCKSEHVISAFENDY